MGLWRGLGARFHGMKDVIGSIPDQSTNNPLHINCLIINSIFSLNLLTQMFASHPSKNPANSDVKPQNHLTLYGAMTSTWHLSYLQSAMLKAVKRKEVRLMPDFFI